MKLHTFFFVCSIFSLVMFTAQSGIAETSSRPNILLILSDDQGWSDIGYNNPRVYTPNLDRLAKEGAVLTQHYVMPQCTPTRLALLTGRYPGRFGITGLQAANRPVIPFNTTTLASFLKAHGYRTYLTGKWHLGSFPEHGPNHHGFHYSYGALAGAVGAYDHRYRLRQHPNSITWHRNLQIIPGYENGRHVTDLVTAEAIRVIKAHADPKSLGGESDNGKTATLAPGSQFGSPFFLYLPYFAPHTPLDERGPFVDMPTQRDPNRPDRWRNEDQIKWFNDPAGIIQQEKDPEKRLFLAVVHHLDDAIGQVVRALEKTGQRSNTVILFSSDNGPQVNWNGTAYPDDLRLTDFNQPIPFRGAKTDVYEGGMRVPAFVNWPAKISPKRIDSVQHIVDWLPTIGGIIGETPMVRAGEPRFDGEDFSDRLFATKQTDVSPREIYALHRTPPNKWALRFGDWKIVKYSQHEPKEADWELYNLQSDPRETANVAAKYPDVVHSLHQKYLRQRASDKTIHNFPEFNSP